MKANCVLRFVKPGEHIRKSGVPENELWLDVGNALEMGCIDHHQNDQYESTLNAMVEHPEFLHDVGACAQKGQKIIVCMHEQPDLDSVSSYFAFCYYLEHGEEEFRSAFGPGGEKYHLVEYINAIDSGRKKDTSEPTLYAIFCCLQETGDKSDEGNQKAVDKGLQLLACALEARGKMDTDLATMDLNGILPKDDFDSEIRKILSCTFDNEEKTKRVKMETVSLWKEVNHKLKVEEVCAAVWEKTPSYSNAYDHARKKGALLTVVPMEIAGQEGANTTRVFISINPEKDPQNEYTLQPLAEILEQMEQVEEERQFEEAGSYRRDHSEPRSNEGVFGEMPFAATSDPWYLSPKKDVIDAPGVHSLLDYKDILKVIRKNGSAVKKAFTVCVAGDSVENKYHDAQVPISHWQKCNRDILAKAKTHVIVWAELDASLIQQNNRMLEAYCMNLTGRPLHENNGENIYFSDYRTCIYSDQDCTIVLTATYDENNLKQLPIASLAGLPSGNELESFRGSRLVKYVSKLLSQRRKLLEYGTLIGSISEGSRKDLEELNSKILAFSAEAQKDDMVANAFEREFYQFIKKQFNIDELKTSVMEEMNLVINESRNRLVSGFNILSAIAVPFVVISTLFQMGVLHFESALDLSGPVKWIGWICTMIIILIITYKLVKRK